ncbi:MAG: methylenetetrahydrofolate reductase [Raoultibacter sp.]
MRISDIYERVEQPLSFEIFPPKGSLSVEAAHAMATELSWLCPDFMSVTYSAGGSGNAQATTAVADMVQHDFGIPVMAHLTCVGMDGARFEQRIADLKAKHVENVLALRGDRVPGCDRTEFAYAKDLIVRLADEGFCIGAAAYPEGHIECPDFRQSIEHLKEKQDAGAQFFVTQLFFDNDCFYRFREAARCAGITVPITCGIMPFLGKAQIQRMVFMCGASLPSAIIKLLAKHESDPQALRQAGIAYAAAQLCDLARHGVDGLHIYTMNQPEIARATVCALRES